MRFLKEDSEIPYTCKISCYYTGMVIPKIEGYVCVDTIKDVAPEPLAEYGMDLILKSLIDVNNLLDVNESDVPEHIRNQFNVKTDEPDICEECGQNFKKLNTAHKYCKKPGCGKEKK